MLLQNKLFWGDNLAVLATHIPSHSIDVCYIDPPFNSKKDYNFLYTNDLQKKQTQKAFTDT